MGPETAIAWNVSSVEIGFENEHFGQVTSRCFSPRHEWCLGTGLLKDRVYYCVQIGLLADAAQRLARFGGGRRSGLTTYAGALAANPFGTVLSGPAGASIS